MAGRYTDRLAGSETIGVTSRTSGGANAYDQSLPKVSRENLRELPYGAISKGAFEKPDVSSFLQGVDIISGRLAEAKAEMQDIKRNQLADDILEVNQATEAMSLHLEGFKRQYLLDHPDGVGLTSAVGEEMKRTFGSFFSGNDVVDAVGTLITQGKILQNKDLGKAVMPGLQKYGTSLLIDAYRQEEQQYISYNSATATTLINNLIQQVGGENVNIVQYHKYKGMFDNIIEYVKNTTGEVNALNIKGATEEKFNQAFGQGLIRQSPALFLQMKEAGELTDILNPTDLSKLTEIAGDKLAIEQHRQAVAAMQKLKADTQVASLNTRRKLYNEIEQDPFRYTENQIQQMQMTRQDMNMVIKFRNDRIKQYAGLDVVKADVQRYVNTRQGVGHLSPEEQQIAIDECGVANGTGRIHPVDRVETANLVGSTYEDKALANKYAFEMFTTKDPLVLKSYYDGFKKAILTKNNIYGKETFGKNTNYVKEFVYACMFNGIDNEPQKMMQYRELTYDLYQGKTEQKQVIDYAEEDKKSKEIINKDYKKRFEDFKQEIYKEYDEYSDEGGGYHYTGRSPAWFEARPIGGIFNLEKKPTPPNYNAIREKIADVPKYASELENKGWSRNDAWGIAVTAFKENLGTSVLYGDDNILMYRPPDDTVPDSRRERKDEFIARHVTACNDIVSGFNYMYFVPGVKSIEYTNAPKGYEYNKIYSVDAELNNVTVTETPMLSDKYTNPRFKVTYADGTTEDNVMMFHEYDDVTGKYHLMLYSPKRDMRAYIITSTGKRAGIDYNAPRLVSATDAYFYKHNVIDFAEACKTDDDFLAQTLGISPKDAKAYIKDVRKLINSLTAKLGLSGEEVRRKLKVKEEEKKVND